MVPLVRRAHGPLALAAVAGTVLATASCGSTTAVSAGSSPSTSGTGAIHVVAGENFWGSIATQVGGSHVTVTSIIDDPNTDPHSYETNPEDAAAVAGAKVVVLNGAGYDDFLAKEVSAAGGSKQVLDVSKVVGLTGADANPHLWYSPTYVRQAAQAIAQQLAADDPADATDFRSNLAAFTAAYQPYVDTIAAIRAKYAGAAISYTERVPGYLVEAAGLHLGTPVSFSQAVEDGTDPTPQDTATFDADITGHTVKALLYNAQVTDPQTTGIKKTATTAGIPVVGVSETIPSQYDTFQAWQIAQAKSLLAALGG